jgi:hypothetical protein
MKFAVLERKLNMEIPEIAKRDLKKAIEFYRKFHWGEEFKNITKVNIEIPKVMTNLGHLIALVYLSPKAGKKDYFIHVFKPPFPILAGSKDPDRLWILGGFFKIEEEGIIK